MDREFEEEDEKQKQEEEEEEEKKTVDEINYTAKDYDFVMLDELLQTQFSIVTYNDVKVVYNGRFGLHEANLLSNALLLCIKKGLKKLNITEPKGYLKKNSYLSILELKRTSAKQSVLLQIYVNGKIYVVNGIGKGNGAKAFEMNPDSCVYIKAKTEPIDNSVGKVKCKDISDELKEFRKFQIQQHDEMMKVAKRLKYTDMDFLPTKLLKQIWSSN